MRRVNQKLNKEALIDWSFFSVCSLFSFRNCLTKFNEKSESGKNE